MTNRHAPDFPSGYPMRSSGAFPKDLRRKVMVVDDDPTILVGVAAYLEANGYLTVQRSESIGTTAAISRERPDIVIMDVEMPGLSGDAISELLTKRKDDLCVIFYSSKAQTELEELVARTGAHGAIPKGDLRNFIAAFEATLPLHLRARR